MITLAEELHLGRTAARDHMVQNFASPDGAVLDAPQVYAVPGRLQLNQWALAGAWTVKRQAIALTVPDGGSSTGSTPATRITLTWVTTTGASSGRLYWENTLGFFDVKKVTVPAAVSVFPNELYQAPRSWAEQAYPNPIYFNEVDKGNHFAAWQEPELFTTEVRAAFRSLR